MPTWGEIIKEIGDVAARLPLSVGAVSSQDLVRRKYIAALTGHSKRPTILYATAWTGSMIANIQPDLLSIVDEDVQGFMETVHGIEGNALDLIVHSPGGSPTAAEAIVRYLRSRFSDIRVIVPHMAMSAATMLACSADKIVMGKHSFLGPIDPQLIMQTSLGARAVPAQAILAQFELAKEECADPVKMRAWLPMLNQYGPDLLITCRNATVLSERLVSSWLAKYMFKGDLDADTKANEISKWLAGHDNFLNHGRSIPRDDLVEKGLYVDSLEDDQTFQDLVLSIFHATSFTFSSTPAVKIIENNLGKAFLKMANFPMLQPPN